MAMIGLYHPFIHFKDDSWLKVSALYWDKMARIVPASYERDSDTGALAQDSEVTRQLASELDFIVNYSPGEVTYPVSEVFTELVANHGEELRRKYDVSNAHDWPVDKATQLYARLRNPHLAYVHSTKLHQLLIARLEEESLAVGHREGAELWAGMHPLLASVYMSALAEEIADVNGLHPTSDETLDHIAATGWSLPRLASVLLDEPTLAVNATYRGSEAPLDPELEGSLAFICLKSVIPTHLDAVPVEKIEEIRGRLGPERFRFQAFVDEIAESLPDFGAGADPEMIQEHLQGEYEKKVEPQVDELRRELAGLGVDSAISATCTSFATPTVLTLIPAVGPLASLAVALGMVPILRAKRREARKVYDASRASYLYRLERDLMPRTLLQRIRDRMQSFVLGV